MTGPDVTRPATAGDARGILWALGAVALFALMFLAGRLTGDVAAPLQIIWLRFVGGAIVVLLRVAAGPDRRRMLTARRLPIHGLRALAGGAGGACAIFAATHLPVATASAIGLLEGVFTAALGVLVLGERLSRDRWAAAALCLAGAAVVVFGRRLGQAAGAAVESIDPSAALAVVASGTDGGAGAPTATLAVLVGLAGALLVSVEIILIKTLARRERITTVLVWVNLLGALLLAVPALLAWRPIPMSLVLAFLCLGPLALVGQVCNLIALRHTDAAVLAPVRYAWIPIGAVFGFVLFGEVPGAWTWAGGAMIVAGGAWLATRDLTSPR